MDLLDAGDCGLLFNAAPTPCLILKPDRHFTVVAANDRYLNLTGTQRENLVGRSLFELFPANLDIAASTGISELRQSLQRVLKDVCTDTMAVYQYEFARETDDEGILRTEHRYCRLANTPVLNDSGEIRFIIHHLEDVTETVRVEEEAQRNHAEQDRKMTALNKRLRAEIVQQEETVQRANAQLEATIEVLEHREAELVRLRSRQDGLAQAYGAQERLAQSVFDNISEGAFILDTTMRIAAVNRAFSEITGYTLPEMIGQLPLYLRANRTPPGTYAAIWDALNSSGSWQGELWNRRKNGELFLQRLTINAILGDGQQAPRYVGVFTDITELRRKDEHLQHLAFYDALTDLPNRLLLQDRLQHALERAARERQRLAVLFVDLDRFKAVNDAFGHEIGDILLQNVARRLRSKLRSMDTVARLGGDEFIVVLEEIESARDCARVAANIIQALDEPISLDGRVVSVGASIGIAMFPEDGAAAADLIRRADGAMYTAKARGGSRAHFAASGIHMQQATAETDSMDDQRL